MRRAYIVPSALKIDRGTNFHKVLLIGEAPPRDDQRPDLAYQLARRAFGSAAELGTVSARPREVDRLVARTRPANLLGRYPGPNPRGPGHGSAFPTRQAAKAAGKAERILRAGLGEWPYRVVLLAGRRVLQAFGVGPDPDPMLRVFTTCEIPFYSVPHPSGVNKWWHDEANRAAMREFLLRLAREVTP